MRQPHGAAGQTFDSHDETEKGMKGHENTTLRPAPRCAPRAGLSASAARLVAVGRPASEASRRGAIPADQASIRGRADNLETVNTACLPVKRPLCCTAHVAVTLGCVQLRRSPKVLEKICGSTAVVNIFTFACGKRSPRLASLICLPTFNSYSLQSHPHPRGIRGRGWSRSAATMASGRCWRVCWQWSGR